MLYWRDIFCKAVKYATRTLRIESARGIGTIILTQVVVGGLLFLGTSFAGAGLPTRVASAFAPFILFPIYVLLFLPTVITEEDAAKVEEIASLNRRVAELEAEGQSDIAIHLNLNYVVWAHVDWRNVVHQYRVVIENVGPNHLTNCVLRLSTANQFNFALHDRTWLKDASAVFELRRGQVETLGILWVDAYDETQPARPNYHSTPPVEAALSG
jgi:hypothetical protein